MTTDTQQQQTLSQQPKTLAERQAELTHHFKFGVRYVHATYREVILKEPFVIDGRPSADCFYGVLNSGEERLVSAYNLGPESANQSKPCAGCGELTAPLDFHPHRRKCKKCVRAESRERKRDIRRTDQFFMMMRLQEVLKKIQTVIKSSPGAERRMLALAGQNLSRSEYDKALDEIIATPSD